jgi:23S rRNA pseudouridine2605 synthase
VPDQDDGLIRLQKLLAQSGVASRRKCEEIMLAGLVEVDGEIVTRLGTKVDPRTAVIRVEGRRLPPASPHVYLVLNKPRGVVSTMADPEGRPDLAGLVADRPERLFHVGRLDTDTEGLLLLTNDGELANRLMHPRYGVSKTYLAEIHGPIGRDLGRRLKKGVKLADGFAKADDFRVFDQVGKRILVEVTLHEGRKHIVRRLLAEAGHPVQQLARTEFGPVKLDRLRSGTIRALTTKEIGELYAAVEL